MKQAYHQIIDANINRVSEGLRVIEDYTRFVSQQKKITDRLSAMRKIVNETETAVQAHLQIRDTAKDLRAGETPRKRPHTVALLKANCKRVEEGLRVLEEYTGNPVFNKLRYEMYDIEKIVVLAASKPILKRGVYLISDDIAILEQGLKWKVSAIQLRDKQNVKKDVLEKAKHIAEKAKKAHIPFFVNDYLDIALVSDADGIHVGQDDLSTAEIRALIGDHKLIGRSTMTLEQGIQAEKEGIDCIGIGPLYPTVSKPEKKAIGLKYLKQAESKISIPTIGIGDVNLAHMPEIAVCKPHMVAIIRAYKEIPKIIATYYQ